MAKIVPFEKDILGPRCPFKERSTNKYKQILMKIKVMSDGKIFHTYFPSIQFDTIVVLVFFSLFSSFGERLGWDILGQKCAL